VRDPFYRRLDKPAVYLGIVVGSWLVFYGGGLLAVLAASGTMAEGVQFGLSLLIWGVFLRTVVVWHITWSVNSVTHMWGYRNYETDEESTNNVIVGFISNGEGWHNNHHADPRSARHGHKWWEFDVTYLSIRFLEMVGLARNIAQPNKHRLASKERLVTHGEAAD
jgi:stearoyl-CoA desaturase (delta-9 desaturase)